MRIKGIQLREFIKSGAFTGMLLIITFALAIVISNNSFLREYYLKFVYSNIAISAGNLGFKTTFIELVNDGLMSFFFLLLGLEMKFHLVEGEYKHKKSLILPTAAALGGVVVPALIYVYFNYDKPELLTGWAIPIATDTAFILGIVSFFQRYTSLELRAFIIGFSLIDDVFALVILALFYTQAIDPFALGISFLVIIILSIMNFLNIRKSIYYVIIGILLWSSMLKAGIHGTLCGAITALFIPVRTPKGLNKSFKNLERFVRPIANYIILPLFVFINSGIVLKNFSLKSVCSSITYGIVLGLFVGKQLGITLFSYPCVKLNWCSLPNNTSWLKFYAIATLGGIGFTLSLFIGSITFESGCPSNSMRVSVILGSLLSAFFGTIILRYSIKHERLSD